MSWWRALRRWVDLQLPPMFADGVDDGGRERCKGCGNLHTPNAVTAEFVAERAGEIPPSLKEWWPGPGGN